MILAIDPGNEQSAWVHYDAGRVLGHGKASNAQVLADLYVLPTERHVAIEMVASYGMAVGKEIFDTVLWIGRFYEAWLRRSGFAPELVYRRDVKLHHCYSARATDANIRAAILDAYGGKDKAIGLKKTPGPLYGITADRWSALAIAMLVAARQKGLEHGPTSPTLQAVVGVGA